MKNRIQIPKSAKEVSLPTNYILVVDTSGSMYDVIDDLKQTILAITNSGNPKDTISIGRFSGTGSWEYFLRGNAIGDVNFKKVVESKIRSTGCTCYNQILDATPDLVNDLKNMNDNKNYSFYFLSDGHPNDGYSEVKVIQVCNKLKNSFSNSRIVGFGRYYGRDILLKMAENIGGQFIHAETLTDFHTDYSNFFQNKVTKVPVAFDTVYDVVFQVTKTGVNVLTQEKDNTVLVDEGDAESYVYAFNLCEIQNNTLDKDALKSSEFVYGAACSLAKKNKSSYGVNLLIQAGDKKSASVLRKAFTVSAKGNAENFLANLAQTAKIVSVQDHKQGMKLSELVSFFNRNDTEILIDTERFQYRSVTKKDKDVSKVKISYPNKFVKVTQTTSNENRVNLSLLTMADVQVVDVIDADLKKRVNEFNTRSDKKIVFPINSVTFRNYAIIANGDFNVNGLPLIINGAKVDLSMEDVEIFDPNIKEIKASEFAKKGEDLLLTKAQQTVINGFIKLITPEGAFKDYDQRVSLYGTDGAVLLEEMGFDSKMRYAPKKEYIPIEKDGDFLTYLEFSVSKDKCSSFSFPKTYEKFINNKQLLQEGKKVKEYTVSENIILNSIKSYVELREKLNDDKEFLESLEIALDAVKHNISNISSHLVGDKFYLMTTNSWFSDVPKSDEVKIGDLTISTEEKKEYL